MKLETRAHDAARGVHRVVDGSTQAPSIVHFERFVARKERGRRIAAGAVVVLIVLVGALLAARLGPGASLPADRRDATLLLPGGATPSELVGSWVTDEITERQAREAANLANLRPGVRLRVFPTSFTLTLHADGRFVTTEADGNVVDEGTYAVYGDMLDLRNAPWNAGPGQIARHLRFSFVTDGSTLRLRLLGVELPSAAAVTGTQRTTAALLVAAYTASIFHST
jgi:hypothetical protein